MPKAATTGGRRYLFRKDVVPDAEGKWYPAEDVAKPAKRAFKPTAAKLRSNITAGTVLILLAGRYRGRRVVFLKQLPSGLLLVTGPYGVNGVPLRRVNQAYVIATSTKVDVAKVAVPAAVNDKLFSGDKAAKQKKGEEDFFALASKKSETSDERKKIQADVDAGVKVTDEQKAYLRSFFTLTKGMKPHALKF